MARNSDPRIAIVGAGFGGIAAAVYLVKAGFRNIVIYERNSGVGGVWHENVYPGAEVDTFSDWYSYKFKRYDWPAPHSGQAVLEAYINETVDDYGLRERIEFGTSVVRATWHEQEQHYELELSDGRRERFAVLISAVGLFNSPRYPEWPGLDQFAGPAFHAARYEHQHDLTGKRVAVIGCGSSGTQIVPQLAQTAGHLFVFQRDPNWIAPKNNGSYSDEERAARRDRRVYAKARRQHWWAETRMLWGGRIFREGTRENRDAQRQMEAHLQTLLGDRPDLLQAVLPNHPFFAKRPVKADGFYEALKRPNVTFRRTAVVEVTRDAIVDSTGERFPVDAIVMATGFRVAEYLRDLEVIGRGNRSIHDVWRSRGGAEAFLGLTVPGFPNFYMLYGPNTNMGQIVFNLETQARYVARQLADMRRRGVGAFDTSPRLHAWYNRWLQKALARTVWPEANNYLKDTSTGKLVLPFPGPMMWYWVLTRMLRRLATRALPAPARKPAARSSPTVVPPDQTSAHEEQQQEEVEAWSLSG